MLIALSLPLFAVVTPAATPPPFDFHLVATAADPALDLWFHTPRDSTPLIPAASHVYKLQPIQLIPIFQGFQRNRQGEAEVTYDVTIFDPDGQLILQHQGLTGIEGPVPEDANLFLAARRLTLTFEADDPFGEYRIEVTARDLTRSLHRKRTVHVTLVPFGYATSPESAQEFRQWLPTYYLQPDPARALLACLRYGEFENPVTGQLDFSQIAFFQTIFSRHPFLIDALVASYDSAPDNIRFRVLFMLAYLNYRERTFLQNLPEPEFAFFESVRLFFPPCPYATIISPQQLDMLWAEFYATGRLAPIRHIISALDLASFEGALHELGESPSDETHDEESRRRAMREMVFPSAQWSLVNNCRQHSLVRAYCLQLLQQGDLSPSEREQLTAVLRTADSTPSRLGSRRNLQHQQPLSSPMRLIIP